MVANEADNERNDKGRFVKGRFVKGNACGVSTRFGPGECGNPRGRPRSVDTWLQGMRDASYTLDELYAVLSDPRAHRNKQDAARVLIVDQFVTEPIPGAMRSQAYRRYRQFTTRRTRPSSASSPIRTIGRTGARALAGG